MENQITQNFTNDELILMSDVILAMQNCLSHANMLLFGWDIQKAAKDRIQALAELNAKVCGYMADEEEIGDGEAA